MRAKTNLVDASSVLALELIFAALLLRDAAVGHDGTVLVGAVHTVGIAVTDPLLGDAHGTAPLLVGATLELSLGVAGSGICYNKNN